MTKQKTLGWAAMAALLAIAVMVGCSVQVQPAPDVVEPAADTEAPEPAEGSASAEEPAAEEEPAADYEASVKQALADFKAGVESQNIDKMMVPFSANFDHYEWGDKETLRGFITAQMNQGVMDGAEVDIENAEISKDGDVVSVYPVEMDASAIGLLTFEFTVEEDDDGVWRVTSMEVDGI